MPCRSSPACGNCISANTSVRLATSVSLWPTPTVSTITTSKPAASTKSIASRVCAATPPSAPDEGEGRMNADGCRESSSMRVLSPSTEPPRHGARRIDREHGHALALLDELEAERLDQRGLAHARRAGEAEPQRLAGARKELRHHLARQRLVIVAGRLGERDRLGEQPPVAADDPRGKTRAFARRQSPPAGNRALNPAGARPPHVATARRGSWPARRRRRREWRCPGRRCPTRLRLRASRNPAAAPRRPRRR